MKTLKVCIENNGSTSITVKGRNGIRIPAHATGDAAVALDLPDTPQIAKTLSRLRREYPALRIKVEKAESCESGDDANGQGQTQETAQGDDSEQSPSDSAPMDKDAFTARVTGTAEKGSGWWHVIVEGVTEPFKVRGAKDAAHAVDLAYDAYLENLTAPAEGE